MKDEFFPTRNSGGETMPGMVPEENSGRPSAHAARNDCGRTDDAAGSLTAHETHRLSVAGEPKASVAACIPRGARASEFSGKGRSDCAAEMSAAQELANVCEDFLRLVRQEHMSVTGAAKLLGRPASTFSGDNSVLGRYLRGGVAALVPGRRAGCPASDLTQRIEDLGWFIPAARFFYLNTNLATDRGSVPEAVRRTISLPHLPIGWTNAARARFLRALADWKVVPECPADLREEILARQNEGKPLVPDRVAKKIIVSAATVRQHRHATNAALDYLSAPGSLFFFNDPLTGERRPPEPGEVIEADDATINFPVCVPWSLGGDPCSDKFGVKVGRFQWLVSVDAARRFVTAWTYVMRPRSSYRGEDALALMRAHCLQHGVPLQWRFEQGVWKSNLVRHAIKAMGSHLHTVWSPHQKPYIEGLFNSMWTKLSVQFPGCDVGRYQGETEEANDLLVACQRGQKDPLRHFPLLSPALAAFTEAVNEKNATPVNSDIGRWVPGEAFKDVARRRLDPDSEWIFAPWVKEWTVKGMLVGGRVPLFEDLSVPFDFSASWLTDFHGAKVRCHFDPSSPSCFATVVLMENFGERKAGEILGVAKQINEVAGYARVVLGWGDDPVNAGRVARQQAASALRREVRAVVGRGGRAGHASSEERDGISTVNKVETDSISESARTSETQSQSASAESAGRLGISREPTAEENAERLERVEQWERENALDLG